MGNSDLLRTLGTWTGSFFFSFLYSFGGRQGFFIFGYTGSLGTFWVAKGIGALRSARFATDRLTDDFTANWAKRKGSGDDMACVGSDGSIVTLKRARIHSWEEHVLELRIFWIFVTPEAIYRHARGKAGEHRTKVRYLQLRYPGSGIGSDDPWDYMYLLPISWAALNDDHCYYCANSGI